ncbi:hypothetical protein EYF80_004783 [Liparis tanakae]|uniref:Uncharacterized protein n=1 Tax=Liparis tanakae TaxID=230148 RepID=A0A4Z2J4X2_9TELE|nr:hypothetical protein EYF80_004783 [Liparis tanakae]
MDGERGSVDVKTQMKEERETSSRDLELSLRQRAASNEKAERAQGFRLVDDTRREVLTGSKERERGSISSRNKVELRSVRKPPLPVGYLGFEETLHSETMFIRRQEERFLRRSREFRQTKEAKEALNVSLLPDDG